jgi:NADH oxidoreductase Hcr
MTQSISPLVWQGAQPLYCVERRQETADAVTLVFRPQQPLTVHYRPGQFLLVTVLIHDQPHSRAYSLSSSPSNTHDLAITVKRVAGGLVSNWLLDQFHVGDMLTAPAPMGSFALPADHLPSQILLCSAGSGITPMMSMVRWLVDQPDRPEIWFLHSARSAAEIIFRDELLALAATHPMFHPLFVLRETTDDFPCYQGRLNPVLFDQLIPPLPDAHVYQCGPDSYMQAIEQWLRDRQFPMDHCHKESFAPVLHSTLESTDLDDVHHYQISVSGFDASIQATGQQTVLEALESIQLPIIAACRSGICGSCKCKVINGTVDDISEQPGPLTEDEQQQGYILACSSRASSNLELELS